ncbi:hypothetical protein [Flammeovirga sp. OC4]|uniref:hypothetical protein n=1 Tax=Flammeovirga sp. OC4 TaxID=1382345 RepID=UPI0005C519AE|nr:hypothetical protein [Flammeovirga sp. OC4]
MGNFEDRLFELFSHKSFEELTLEEKQEVLKVMTQQEYQENYQMVHEFKNVNDGISMAIPPLELKSEKKVLFLEQSIPIYKAAAAIVIGVLLSISVQFFITQNSKEIPIKQEVTKQSIPLSEENYPKGLVVNL